MPDPSSHADDLLRSAMPWGSDPTAALRIWRNEPEVARHSIHTAAMCGDLQEVQRRLAEDPTAAATKGGPLGWEPLLYLAYGRVPGAEVQAVPVATALLDAGADPSAGFDDDWGNRFTLLNGVVGQGEQGRSEHPRAEALAALFIARGADPFGTQVLYDTSVQGDDPRWLEFLWRQCEARGGTQRWRESANGLGGRYPRTALDYLLGNAVGADHLARAEWLLGHGADPNTLQAYSGRPVHVEAQLEGSPAMVALLERHGASPVVLSGGPAFVAACVRGDLDAARDAARTDPAVLRDPAALIAAAQRGLGEVVTLLLDLGTPVDLARHDGKGALHWAAQRGQVGVARVLVAAGADVDRRGSEYRGTPLGFALHFGQSAMIDFLAPLTRDVHGLCRAGRIDRVEELLRAEPGRVGERNPHGAPILFALPDDETAAADVAALLLRHGADPAATDAEGKTPAQAARQRGLDEAAQRIEAAGPR